MKNFFHWLADVFTVETIWIEKEQGHWVKRKRFHPVMKALLFACFLLLGAGCWRALVVPLSPDTEPASPVAAVSSPDIEPPRLRMTDFPGAVYPGPIPAGLRVADGEYWIRIDKGNYKLYLYNGFDVEKTYDIAVGRNPGDKQRVGDNKTPNGIFTVQSIEDSKTWSHDFQDGNGIIRGAYGPWFIRLRTGWNGIGIHGTHDPDSLGSMVSEGCVRMHNAELEELKKFAAVKMKVVIEE